MYDKKLIVISIITTISLFVLLPLYKLPFLEGTGKTVYCSVFLVGFHLIFISKYFQRFYATKRVRLLSFFVIGYFSSVFAMIPLLIMHVTKTTYSFVSMWKTMMFALYILSLYPIVLFGWLYGAVFYIIYSSKEKTGQWKSFFMVAGVFLILASIIRIGLTWFL